MDWFLIVFLEISNFSKSRFCWLSQRRNDFIADWVNAETETTFEESNFFCKWSYKRKQTAFSLYFYTTRQYNSMVLINVKCCFGKPSMVLSDSPTMPKNSLLHSTAASRLQLFTHTKSSTDCKVAGGIREFHAAQFTPRQFKFKLKNRHDI